MPNRRAVAQQVAHRQQVAEWHRARARLEAATQELTEAQARDLTNGYLTMAFGAVVGALIANGHGIPELRSMLASAIAAQVRTPERPDDGT